MNEDMQKVYTELKKKLPVDLLALDDELQELPQITQEVVEWAAKSIALRDALASELKLAKAQAMDRIRTSGEKKPPETQVESDSLRDPKYIVSNNDYQDANADADLWKGLAESFRTKMTAIKEICGLIQMGYTTVQAITNKKRQELHDSRK